MKSSQEKQMKISIRKVTLSELEAIYKIEEKVFSPMNYPLFVIRQYYDLFSDYFLVAENEEKEIAGYILGGINPKEKDGWILALATEKKFRKQGIGLKLISTVIKKINELDITSILLTTEPNTPAVDFYKKLGFEIIKNESNYFGDHSGRVIMQLNQKLDV
ncbi:GNAT family N-acetyltransferase [Aquimarina megaterium]|uniref:GNAT family N-acetyltransferase n=1 Tax=Aquimarina megaterium TaxID=1443666 RepID=UPI0004B49965|nr:N-acetyltransferase [Aquimarina megaterium]